MSHGHKETHHRHISKSREFLKNQQKSTLFPSKPKLDVVLKCDSAGSLEAVTQSILNMEQTGVDISIIHAEIGNIHKSDILMADTGSRLIIGFQVGMEPGVKNALQEADVDVRFYDVIYKLTEDIKSIADDMVPHVNEENIIGSAKVIALFKSGRKDIIAGCKVISGSLSLHHRYRLISAMGPVHTDTIESMHIEDHVVQKAVKDQEVGIKIKNFKRIKIGDLLETFKPGR
jgi:translation initiation factor IF-2